VLGDEFCWILFGAYWLFLYFSIHHKTQYTRQSGILHNRAQTVSEKIHFETKIFVDFYQYFFQYHMN